MTAANAAGFDADVRDLVFAHRAETVTLSLITRITWGKPHEPAAENRQNDHLNASVLLCQRGAEEDGIFAPQNAL